MTDVGTERVDEELLSGEVEPLDHGALARRSLFIGGIVVLVVILLAFFLTSRSIGERERQFNEDLSQRLEIFAQGRAGVIDAWLEGVMNTTRRVTDSDLFRLFATEANTLEQAISGGAPNAGDSRQLTTAFTEQLPLMTNVLKEFVQNSGFLHGRVVSRSGDVYISTDAVIEMTAHEKTLGMQAFETGAPVMGPVQAADQGLLLSLALPIFPPQAEPSQANVVSSLVLTFGVHGKIAQFLEPPALARRGERVRIVQQHDGVTSLLAPGTLPPVRPIGSEADAVAPTGTRWPLDQRMSLTGDERVYSAGALVAPLSWWIVMESDIDLARTAVDDHRGNVIGIAVLAVAVLLVAFGAFWWKLAGDRNKALATQFQRLATRINTQRRLLDGINNTIADHIGLKSTDGKYVYANPAFADAVGRPLTELIGLDDSAIYGHGTAERLAPSDREAMERRQPVTVNERIFLKDVAHHLQISKVPLTEDGGQPTGIVSVARDITDLVLEQERRERAVRQTVTALVRAIELRDPYLAGHSRRLSSLAAMVATQLSAAPTVIATVEIAANLSQIGKLTISRALLTKTERLTAEEVAIVQGHVDHAAKVLRDIDFGLPVYEAIYQMHERLDGAGYPNQLKGDDVRIEARILGACDVFCARIAPRSYRPGITTDAAMEILRENSDRYDPAVIEALQRVVASRDGERLLSSLSV